jgi:predicted acetylornithine/succinylornithine family transaminase
MIIENEKKFIAPTYTRPEVVFTHGEGVYLYDTNGQRYLDFCAGIAVNALGHSDPDWVAAVRSQAGLLTHVSNLYHTAPAVELAERLVNASFADKVYFANSGAESNEGAIKFARKYQRVHGREDKTTIVAFSGAFHGRTMGALAVTPREKYQKYFRPLMPDVRVGEFNDLASAESVISADTAAVIVEPVQGEGGIRPAKQAFLQRVRELCDQHDALLIFDEVQCGLGRTGYLFAYEAFGVAPDLLTLAKPLAGGLPIGAVLMTDAVAATIQPGDHASTFAGGPLVARAAQVVFDKVSDPAMLAHIRDMGEHLHEQLESKLPKDKLVEIRGMGLMIGVELTVPVAPLVPRMAAQGLLTVGAGETVLRLVPPLIIDRQHVDTATDIIADVLEGA